MNPQIREYWERHHATMADVNEAGVAFINSEDAGSFMIAIRYDALKILDRDGIYSSRLSYLQDEDWVYPFNGNFNDEETMLKILKLKAFL